MRRLLSAVIGACAVSLAGYASAQITAPLAGSKSPGAEYAPPAYRPPSYSPPSHSPPAYSPPPAYAPAPPSMATPLGTDPEAERLSRSLPLAPATRDAQDRLPPDPGMVERQLGLRQPVGPATDLRGHVPSTQEIVNGLNRR
jgi:hypothetical protein